MILSPPFLPQVDPATATSDDPLMDIVDGYEAWHGKYPIAADRRWHPGVHLTPPVAGAVHAIADGEVVAFRVCQHAHGPTPDERDSHAGFVLLKHTLETGEGRTLTFYSLYMHLLPLSEYRFIGSGLEDLLPAFLRQPTPDSHTPHRIGKAQPGEGRKVARKAILGWLGQCHTLQHLHLEIFVRAPDFQAYFGPTALRGPLPPPSTDVWGHTYYVIPGAQTFHRLPPRSPPPSGDKDTPPPDYFPPLQDGTLAPGHTLYVEVFFHHGQRYTRSWLDRGEGQRVALSDAPVRDPFKDYEYTLYARATALYPACPSEGYELLRFGRTLGDAPTLVSPPAHLPDQYSAPGVRRRNPAPDPRATWVAVMFAEGTLGYLDISPDSIHKCSDAQFPRFTGWHTVDSAAMTPFDDDGLCSHVALCTLLGDDEGADNARQPDRLQRDEAQRLHAYLEERDALRHRLRGFVCQTTSPWDASLNPWRYRLLTEPGGYFYERQEEDPDGYRTFFDYWETMQFWSETGLQPGETLWYFHPLRFIRHFRRCGWLSEEELIQTLPTSAMRPVALDKWVTEPVDLTQGRKDTADRTYIELNKSLRKYNIAPNPWRMAAFLANAFVETEWLSKLYEKNLDAWYYPWDGRGFLQLTGPDNYIKYWRFLGRDVPKALENELDAAAKSAQAEFLDCAKDAAEARRRGDQQAYERAKARAKRANAGLRDADHPGLTPQILQWRKDVSDGHHDPVASAGAYWAWSGVARYADRPPDWIWRVQYPDNTKKAEVYYRSDSFGQVAAIVNYGRPVKSPKDFARINGIVARFQAYVYAVVMLTDGTQFPD